MFTLSTWCIWCLTCFSVATWVTISLVVDGKYLRIDFSNTVSPQNFVSWVTVQEGHKISAHFGGKQSFYNHKVSSKYNDLKIIFLLFHLKLKLACILYLNFSTCYLYFFLQFLFSKLFLDNIIFLKWLLTSRH